MPVPHPDQISMVDDLERASPGVAPEEDALIRGYVADTLPTGVPTYIRRVLAVRPHTDGRGGYEADVEVFDDRPATLRVSGPLGSARYKWTFPAGDEPFGWETTKRVWKRLPDGTRARMQRDRAAQP